MDENRLKDIQAKKAVLEAELKEAQAKGIPEDDLAAIQTLIDALAKDEEEAKLD